MPATLDLQVEDKERLTIVTVSGPVDSATFAQFKEALDPLFRKRGHAILMDCKDLTYVNSTALGLLLAYHRTSLVNTGHFVLCSVNPKVIRTMELLGIGKRLKTFDSREEALSDLTA
ncbi:MAG: STAS domain-containing protein [Verrucomicrobia bacterium]|nr:STAS domain-containing protein [Verrucomicrobiota bacterium]